jgi:hypothetical protein
MRLLGCSSLAGIAVLALACGGVNPPAYGEITPAAEGPYLGQDPPGDTARLFAPAISDHEVHSAIVFSPSGNGTFWVPMRDRSQRIVSMRMRDGRWEYGGVFEPTGGADSDDPFLSPDGQQLFFTSNRPKGILGFFKRMETVWFVDREGEAWSKPQPLPLPVSHLRMHWAFSLAGNGNLYFSAIDELQDTPPDIYRLVTGSLPWVEPLPPSINSPHSEETRHFTPDGRVLLFSRWERGGPPPTSSWWRRIMRGIGRIPKGWGRG